MTAHIVKLPPALRAFLEEEAKAGGYKDASEYAVMLIEEEVARRIARRKTEQSKLAR